jgi:hypothetical protein
MQTKDHFAQIASANGFNIFQFYCIRAKAQFLSSRWRRLVGAKKKAVRLNPDRLELLMSA